jgi:hypothetical protein
MHRKAGFRDNAFPWIYAFVGTSDLEMGLREKLFARETGAYLKPIGGIREGSLN